MEVDIATLDTLDEVLSQLSADERQEVIKELEGDGLWTTSL